MRALPLLPVLLALGLVAILRPDILTGATGSPLAWAATVGVVLASYLVRRVVRRWSAAAAPWAGTAVTLGLLGALVLPSFQERTLVEDFPPVVDSLAAGTAAELLPATPSPSALPLPTPSLSPSAVPTAAATARATTAPRVPAAPTATVSPAAAPASAVPTAKPSPTAVTATRLLTGSLQGIGHQASGRTSIYRVGNGLVLRFEDVDIQGSVDPSVHLVPQGQRSPGGGLRLGALKAEHGSFSYALPAGFDLAKPWSVLVWCDPYDTPIGASDLS